MIKGSWNNVESGYDYMHNNVGLILFMTSYIRGQFNRRNTGAVLNNQPQKVGIISIS